MPVLNVCTDCKVLYCVCLNLWGNAKAMDVLCPDTIICHLLWWKQKITLRAVNCSASRWVRERVASWCLLSTSNQPQSDPFFIGQSYTAHVLVHDSECVVLKRTTLVYSGSVFWRFKRELYQRNGGHRCSESSLILLPWFGNRRCS